MPKISALGGPHRNLSPESVFARQSQLLIGSVTVTAVLIVLLSGWLRDSNTVIDEEVSSKQFQVRVTWTDDPNHPKLTSERNQFSIYSVEQQPKTVVYTATGTSFPTSTYALDTTKPPAVPSTGMVQVAGFKKSYSSSESSFPSMTTIQRSSLATSNEADLTNSTALTQGKHPNINRMLVIELRAALRELGLSELGAKPHLKKRLKAAWEGAEPGPGDRAKWDPTQRKDSGVSELKMPPKVTTCFKNTAPRPFGIPNPPHGALPPWFNPSGAEGYNSTVTVFLWANPRLASIFRTCRLARASTRFNYDVYDLRQQVRNSNRGQVANLFEKFTGMKIIVFDGCCVPGYMLMQWPKNSLLVISSDESARWGFALPKGKNYFGPHGPKGEVPSDTNMTIVMPRNTTPWFKQYYSSRHVNQFGDDVRYIPLGSREEFTDAPYTLKPANKRKYLYSFMGAPTDISRKKVRDVLRADTRIPENRSLLYMAEHWDANPNSDRNTYIKPEQYREIMLDSAFTLCPKGHSIEQFRLYEAIEAGSIPILALEGGCPGGCPSYAKDRMPPEYFDSPIIVVQDWDTVVDVMLLYDSNSTMLLERQKALAKW